MSFLGGDEYRVAHDGASLLFDGDAGAVRARFRIRPETDGLWHDIREGARSLLVGNTSVPRTDFDLEDADGVPRFALVREAGTSVMLEMRVLDADGTPVGAVTTPGMPLPFATIELHDAEGRVVGRMRSAVDITAWDDRGALAEAVPSAVRARRPIWELRFAGSASPAARVLVVAALVGLVFRG